MSPEKDIYESLLGEAGPVLSDLYSQCRENAPNFGVREECFKASLRKTIRKYIFSGGQENTITLQDILAFINDIQASDLFMAIACASGNERAWWEFDQNHRSYLERVARHLASSEADAQEVIDLVYVELYGTRVVDGERVSKFASYSGRGSLRGWLRTVVWHSLVDLHRTSHDEVSLDEMTENVGESHAHSNFAEPARGGESEMLGLITRERYRKATLAAIENSFAALDAHEKLLLLYYHVENLKLREIARLVESPSSPLRNWFQRRSASREADPESRIHESTVMRWLEKTYARILKDFRQELLGKAGLREEEVAICLKLATEDLASPNIYKNLMAT